MKKTIKGFIFAIALVFAFFAFANSYKVKGLDPNTTDPYYIAGAQIRLSDATSGMRFVGVVNENEPTHQYGFLIVFGKVAEADELGAGSLNYASESYNGKTVVKYLTSELDVDNVAGIGENTRCIRFTLYDIPASMYGQYVSVVMFMYDGTNYTYTQSKFRNIANVAREAYNDAETPDTFISTVAQACAVRVKDADGNDNYYSSLNGVTLAAGDTVTYIKGTFNDTINVSVNNLTLKGYYSGIKTDSSTRSAAKETVLTNLISVQSNVYGLTINGFKFDGQEFVKLIDNNHNNISIKYNIINFTGSNCIYDAQGELDNNDLLTHSNISIVKNLFNGSNATQKMIGFVGPVSSINVEENKFVDNITLLNDGNYPIKIARVADDGLVQIKNNIFNCYGSNYLIEIGANNNYAVVLGGIPANIVNVNIENNIMSTEYSNTIKGNGIAVYYLSTGSNVSIIHNTRFRVSKYYNTIMLSGEIAANCTTNQMPNVNILYNDFYYEGSYYIKPSNRTKNTTVTSSRIGLGLCAESNDYHINVQYNYFSNGDGARSGYTDNAASGAKSSTNQVVLSTNKVTKTTDPDTGSEIKASTITSNYYNEYVAPYDTFDLAIDALVDAFAADPTTTVPEAINTKIQIQSGVLVYVGSDFIEKIICNNYGIAAGTAQ